MTRFPVRAVTDSCPEWAPRDAPKGPLVRHDIDLSFTSSGRGMVVRRGFMRRIICSDGRSFK